MTILATTVASDAMSHQLIPRASVAPRTSIRTLYLSGTAPADPNSGIRKLSKGTLDSDRRENGSRNVNKNCVTKSGTSSRITRFDGFRIEKGSMAKPWQQGNHQTVVNSERVQGAFGNVRYPKAWMHVARRLRSSGDATVAHEAPIATRHWNTASGADRTLRLNPEWAIDTQFVQP